MFNIAMQSVIQLMIFFILIEFIVLGLLGCVCMWTYLAKD